MLPPPPSFLAPLLARPVAVFGAGVSGQGVLELLAALGARGLIYDERAEAAVKTFDATRAREHALVIFSPGFAPEHAWLAAARAAGCICLGELDFASLFWRGELVAITGTNGKTTLTEFLAHALRSIGRRAAVTGNVGYPFSRFVVEQVGRADIAICEVSSFQAETLEHLTPTSALWTNFAEDHLERHPGMNAYFAAKARLFERTPSREARLVGPSVVRFARTAQGALPPALEVVTENQPADARLAGSVFENYPQRENFLLALAWWRHAGLPEESLFAAARSFELGDHRLTRVAEKGGVTYWNDSKATNFHAVEAALGNFTSPVLLIAGGKAKGGDLAGFVRRLADSKQVRHVFLLGETKPALANYCAACALPATSCATLEDAVRSAAAAARAGEHVLLSPGFASFDMFAGYADRGRQFVKLVGNL